MSTFDRMKGKIEEVAGAARARVGQAFHNEEMRTRGEAMRAEGHARAEAARMGTQLEGTFDKLKGKVQGAAGAVSGDTSTEVAGKYSQVKGDLKQNLSERSPKE